jgi:hypothetical protein
LTGLKVRVLAAATLLLSLFAETALAQSTVGPVPITRIRTGWATDMFALETGAAISNPAGCPSPNGYFSLGTEPGYKTFYAAALMAFSTGKNVTIMVSSTDCTSGAPRIIGIYLEK